MTTEEFIEAVNVLDNRDEIDAEVAPDGTVSLYKCGYSLVAALGTDAIKWRFYSVDVTIPTKILKLMVELAESKEEENKYVILNAMPCHQHWHFFRIGEGGEYLKAYTTNDPAILINSAYTLDELEYKKAWLPKLWRNAIDRMLTPLDMALEGIA